MQAPSASSHLAPGQRFRVNTFDLGFINIDPVDVIVEVKAVCYETNELEMAPLPLPGTVMHESLARVTSWFRESYSGRSKSDCLLKNVQAFEQLVDLHLAVAEKRLTLSSLSPITLLSA